MLVYLQNNQYVFDILTIGTLGILVHFLKRRVEYQSKDREDTVGSGVISSRASVEGTKSLPCSLV